MPAYKKKIIVMKRKDKKDTCFKEYHSWWKTGPDQSSSPRRQKAQSNHWLLFDDRKSGY